MKKTQKLTEAGISLSAQEQCQNQGGRLWPWFDISQIFSQIYYGEDITLLDQLRIEKL